MTSIHYLQSRLKNKVDKYIHFSTALLLGLFLFPAAALAAFPVAEQGRAACVIVRQAGATEAERHAADELAETLQQITGAMIPVQDALPIDSAQPVILIGPGVATTARFPDLELARFGAEETIRRLNSSGRTLLLAGGRPRGTVYAVSQFLQEQGGVRWWTPWATDIPTRPTFHIGKLNKRDAPAFEYREPYWHLAFDGNWAAHNFSNGEMTGITPEQGGKITYANQFVHTFSVLVPENPNLTLHPEWFSLRGGKRVGGAQLCLTNPALKDFVVTRVREWLKANPGGGIVSISQNDNVGFCECPVCKAVDDREGSHSGTIISFVNAIAQALEPEFPHVAFDTLAYQYTRHPPRTVRPRPSVIVRLCSIECNFGAPFTDKSNAAFAADLSDWSKICNRLYVWDYTTNFRSYLQPHPNWFTLGPNLRLFQSSHVLGVFSEGAYESNGAEMAELRSWVLARLMWNPKQDDRALIDEFLKGYYGAKAAPFIRRYLALAEQQVKGFNLTCYTGGAAPFLTLPALTEADHLWQEAELASADDPAKLWRVRVGHLPIGLAWLSAWQRLRLEARRTGAAWPLPDSRKAAAAAWLSEATAPGPSGWTPITHLHEGGGTPQAFVASLGEDPPPPADPPTRRINPPPPADISETRLGVDLQDDKATLYQEGDLSEIRGDSDASDGLAVWMPGSHHEWAFQIPVARFPKTAQTGRWKVYAVVRVAKKPGATIAPNSAAFVAGVWDAKAMVDRANMPVLAATIPEGYHTYLLGSVDLNRDQYVWIAPNANSAIDSVWIDRVYLVPDTMVR